jgi:hypothetical protein
MSQPNINDEKNNLPDNADYTEYDMDPGDWEKCGECKQWVLFEEDTEVRDDHKTVIVRTCPECGAVKEEI